MNTTEKQKTPAGWLEVVMLVVALSGLSFLASYYVVNQRIAQVNSHKILFLNSKLLLSSKMDSMQKELKTGKTQIRGQGSKFAKELAKVLSWYDENGYTVINSRAAVVYPNDQDITTNVAKALHVKLVVPPPPPSTAKD